MANTYYSTSCLPGDRGALERSTVEQLRLGKSLPPPHPEIFLAEALVPCIFLLRFSLG